ncbi:lysyl-tRNA synthetase [uncultured archaeon]|nr:lysyl-tRNA synthetase [uncultured archaeon]
MHWADAFVRNLSGDQIFSTGISPSGPIHVGNMREILTGDILYKAAVDRGLMSRFMYLCDDLDPLRKVYPFLPDTYEEHVGKPLSRIPAPQGEGTYSEYFLRPFLETLDVINVSVEVVRTTDLYDRGVFAEAIDVVMRRKNDVARILEEISGRAVGKDWYPYNPLCSNCGRITKAKVEWYRFPEVGYRCQCGHEGVSDIRKAEGKMPWRVEWPAKWYALGVTVEPFGKDHGVKGGSYDTGKGIMEEIFGAKAPEPLIYEHIFLKGKGAMHSSTGVVIDAADMVKFAPPQILRFLVARSQPSRHIMFDPGAGLLNLIDEYEKYENLYASGGELDEDARRAYELSRLEQSTEKLSSIGFRHLVTLVQIYPREGDLLEALRRTGEGLDEITPVVRSNIDAIRRWLDRYAPDNVKFSLLEPHEKVVINDQERKLIAGFLESAGSIQWTPEAIHDMIHELIRNSGMQPKSGFAAFYRVLVGKERGPRLGYFLSTLGREFTMNRLSSAINM